MSKEYISEKSKLSDIYKPRPEYRTYEEIKKDWASELLLLAWLNGETETK